MFIVKLLSVPTPFIEPVKLPVIIKSSTPELPVKLLTFSNSITSVESFVFVTEPIPAPLTSHVLLTARPVNVSVLEFPIIFSKLVKIKPFVVTADISSFKVPAFFAVSTQLFIRSDAIKASLPLLPVAVT